MKLTRTRTALAVFVLLIGTACNSSTEPRDAFALCVHAVGAPFVPGSTGAVCVAPPMIRQGQTVTVVLEADNRAGAPRTADLTILTAPPSGWTVTLGGPTIAVPGQQTLTFATPDAAPPGFYQFTIRASIGINVEAELTFNIRITAPI